MARRGIQPFEQLAVLLAEVFNMTRQAVMTQSNWFGPLIARWLNCSQLNIFRVKLEYSAKVTKVFSHNPLLENGRWGRSCKILETQYRTQSMLSLKLYLSQAMALTQWLNKPKSSRSCRASFKNLGQNLGQTDKQPDRVVYIVALQLKMSSNYRGHI